MAYDHGLKYVRLTTTGGADALAATATTTVKRFRWLVGSDVVVRSVGIISTVTKAGALSFSWRVTATAGAASASGTEFARTTLATTNQKGKVTARKGLNTTASAGSEVIAQVRAAVTGYTVGAFVYAESRPYDFANKTRVTTVTT